MMTGARRHSASDMWVTIIIAVAFAFLFFTSGATPDKKIEKRHTKQRSSAMHKKADKSMLRQVPNDGEFILGMQDGKYVVWDTSKDAHILIVGGSGSGKSSCIVIPFLLSNPDACVFAVDVKGELVMKGRELSDPRICVFSPMDHSGFGFDPFHGLSTDSSPQLILETMQTVVFSLIPLGTSKETFWPISARNMLVGLMIYYFNHGRHDLIEIIDSVLGSPVRDQIEEIINTEDPSGNAYKYLVQFYGMADETLLSVYSNMANSLSCFSDINLRWAFSGAARKVNALTLESGKSVFLSIPEHKLAPWSGVLAMIINLTLDTLSKRPEGKHRVFFLLDELGRIISSGGAMDGLVDASMTLRSRGVTLCMVVQQIESLETGFSEAKTTTLVGNCNIKIILDASSSKTQQTVCRDWVPKYFQRKQSKSTGGKSPNNNYSFEETERLSPSDLMSLPKNGEAVVITPLGYTMIKKCPYYKDEFLKKRADRVSSHNKEVMR